MVETKINVENPPVVSRVLAAFDKHMETDEAKTLARRFGGAVQFLGIFEAGWRAGIASTNDLEIPAFLRPAPKPVLSPGMEATHPKPMDFSGDDR